MAGFRELLKIEVDDRMEDGARLKLRATSEHLNPGGSVHGGAIATLIDTAMGEAVATSPDRDIPVTVEIKVNYLEPAGPGVLIATARVHKRGKRFTVVEADVIQEGTEDPIAFATATFTTVG